MHMVWPRSATDTEKNELLSKLDEQRMEPDFLLDMDEHMRKELEQIIPLFGLRAAFMKALEAYKKAQKSA